METNMSNYGVIQEQGDMGLGFNPINGDEQEVVKEYCEADNTQTKSE